MMIPIREHFQVKQLGLRIHLKMAVGLGICVYGACKPKMIKYYNLVQSFTNSYTIIKLEHQIRAFLYQKLVAIQAHVLLFSYH